MYDRIALASVSLQKASKSLKYRQTKAIPCSWKLEILQRSPWPRNTPLLTEQKSCRMAGLFKFHSSSEYTSVTLVSFLEKTIPLRGISHPYRKSKERETKTRGPNLLCTLDGMPHDGNTLSRKNNASVCRCLLTPSSALTAWGLWTLNPFHPPREGFLVGIMLPREPSTSVTQQQQCQAAALPHQDKFSSWQCFWWHCPEHLPIERQSGTATGVNKQRHTGKTSSWQTNVWYMILQSRSLRNAFLCPKIQRFKAVFPSHTTMSFLIRKFRPSLRICRHIYLHPKTKTPGIIPSTNQQYFQAIAFRVELYSHISACLSKDTNTWGSSVQINPCQRQNSVYWIWHPKEVAQIINLFTLNADAESSPSVSTPAHAAAPTLAREWNRHFYLQMVIKTPVKMSKKVKFTRNEISSVTLCENSSAAVPDWSHYDKPSLKS